MTTKRRKPRAVVLTKESAPPPRGPVLTAVVLGAVCLWLLVIGLVVAVPAHTPLWLRVLGLIGAVAAVLQLARLVLGPGVRRRRLRLRLHRQDARVSPALTARAPELAASIGDALTMLDGPLGHLLGEDATQSTRAAFSSGVTRADELYAQEADLRGHLTKLGDALREAGAKPDADSQYTSMKDDLTALSARRLRADSDLSSAAEQLQQSLADAVYGKQRRRATGRLRNERERALIAASAPDVVLAQDASLDDLTDAMAEVRGHLSAIQELDAITDRYAPDERQVENE